MPRMQGQFVSKSGEQEQMEDAKVVNLDNLREVMLLGRLTEVVKVSGFSFELCTLSTREQKEIINKIMSMQTDNKMLDIRPVTLAFSLKSINGVSLENLSENLELSDPVEKKIDVILNMQTNLVDKLFKTYEKLLEESNRQIGLEEIKK